MTKIILSILFFLLFTFAALALFSCKCADCPKNDEPDIPANVTRAGDQLIVSKTGPDFFEKYITPDFEGSKDLPGGFFMSYRMYMPERPYVDEKITFGLDSNGVLRTDIPVTGIPDCAASPADCSFLIDENEAVKAAAEGGLPEGIKEWGKTFMWNSELNKYVWHIVSTLKGSEGPDGFRGSGVEMIIDSNSGEVLRQSEWNVR